LGRKKKKAGRVRRQRLVLFCETAKRFVGAAIIPAEENLGELSRKRRKAKENCTRKGPRFAGAAGNMVQFTISDTANTLDPAAKLGLFFHHSFWDYVRAFAGGYSVAREPPAFLNPFESKGRREDVAPAFEFLGS